MRVAMVSEHANPLAALGGVDAGGQNVHVAALASALADRGHEVVVHTRADDPHAPAVVPLAPGVVVHHVPAGPLAPLPKDELLPHMDELGDRLAETWRLRPPDVVHSHFWMSGLAATRAAAGLGLPVVHTFHALGVVKRRHQGLVDTSPRGRVRAEAALTTRVDRVVATCPDEVRELLRLGAPAAALRVVPCGVDVERFTPGSGRRPDATPRLLVLGRLVPRKGIDDVIRALTLLPGVELVVAGGAEAGALDDDDEARRLQVLAGELGVAARVHLLGSVGRDDVPALIRSADAVVCTPWYEPFGIVPLEAMACGVPVIASAVGGLADTVVDGVTGWHVPPRDPGAIADTAAAVLADVDRARAMGRAGRARAVTRYAWPEVAAATEQVYGEVLASVPAGHEAARP